MAANLKMSLLKSLRKLDAVPKGQLLQRRYEKFRRMGVFTENLPVSELEAETSETVD